MELSDHALGVIAPGATADLIAMNGDPLADLTDIGPMVDARQQQRVQRYAEIGVEEGARLLYQGAVPSEPHLSGGYFVAPTILADVRPEFKDLGKGYGVPHNYGAMGIIYNSQTVKDPPKDWKAFVEGTVAGKWKASMPGVNYPSGGLAISVWLFADQYGGGVDNTAPGLAQIKRMEEAVLATPPGPKRDEGVRTVRRMYDDLQEEIRHNEAMGMERRRTEAIESMANSMQEQNVQPSYTPSGY